MKASTIVLGCRNVDAGEAAKRQILRSGSAASPAVYVWPIEMADYASVKAFAERMKRELPRCDALVANAGISTNGYHAAEGLERTLTVNVVSTFLLAVLALPLLQETAQANNVETHLTIVGSNVHCFADDSQLQRYAAGERFQRLSDKKEADMAGRYFSSKLIVMLCVRELALRNSESKASVIINCPSPGWCKTALFRQDDGGFMARTMLRLIGRTAEVGGRTLTSAIAAGPETHGQYVSECRVKPASVFVQSEDGRRVQREIWEELVNIIRGIAPEALSGIDEKAE